MKKQNKKTEISIVRALNDVCDSLKNEDVGFSWLTHFVDYSNFPQSLKLVFVFDTNTHLEDAKSKALHETIFELTDTAFKVEGITIKNRDNLMLFDSEENGADVDSTKWCRKYA